MIKSASSEYYMEGKKKKLKKEVRKNVRVEPNVGAGIFLLTNLAPDRWKNKQNTQHSGDVSSLNFAISSIVFNNIL